MSSSRNSCSVCIYWQSYPLIGHVGVCWNPDSEYYSRGVSVSNEVCKYFTPSETEERRCDECHDWYPLDTMPHLGVCQNPASPRYRKAVLWDHTSGDCFEERSLERVEFAWCGVCRETVLVSELDRHRSHSLYAGTSRLPAEDIVEVTSAGD